MVFSVRRRRVTGRSWIWESAQQVLSKLKFSMAFCLQCRCRAVSSSCQFGLLPDSMPCFPCVASLSLMSIRTFLWVPEMQASKSRQVCVKYSSCLFFG